MEGASPTEEQQTAQTGADAAGADERDPSAPSNVSDHSRRPPPSTSQRCRHPRAHAHCGSARARIPPNPALVVPQELRERALRFVRADGAPEVIIKEKALPETPPNALLVLCLDAVESVDDAEWGGRGGGFKSQVLAWLTGSALEPAPPPDTAQAEAKRLMQQAKQVRRDMAATGSDEKREAIRSRPYPLFKPLLVPAPAHDAVEGAQLGSSDGGDDDGGDGGIDGGDDDDEEREPLPPSPPGREPRDRERVRHLGARRRTHRPGWCGFCQRVLRPARCSTAR